MVFVGVRVAFAIPRERRGYSETGAEAAMETKL
jgi:hypothetical protein